MKSRGPLALQSDTRLEISNGSIVCVAGAQHGRETGRFQLAPPALAGLLEAAAIARFLERAFAVDPFFESPQGSFYWFAFL